MMDIHDISLRLYRTPVNLFKVLTDSRWYDGRTYFPEKQRKPKFRRFLDQISQTLKYGYPDPYYFMYGLDWKTGKEYDSYLNYKPFMDRRNYLNYQRLSVSNSCIVLRNKLYFDVFAKGFGLRTPKIAAYLSAGKLHIWRDGFVESGFEELLELGTDAEGVELFCKETEGQCGTGIFRLKIAGGKMYMNGEEITPDMLRSRISGAEYLFQEVVRQHPEMSRLYPGSINTIRLVTVRSLKDGSIHVLPSILRIGANGSFVDNTSQGGIAVGFDLETGRLNKYGNYKPEFGFRTDVHPNTGVVLGDFMIPFIDDIKADAVRFHSALKDIHSVGWDIAVGPDGPVFIEGNDNWEINGPQVGNHGLRKEFEEYFFE